MYLHTDHFEPWKKMPGRRNLCQENADDLVYFTDQIKKLAYARRLTLFYRNYWAVGVGEKGDVIRPHPEDRIGFRRRTEEEDRIAASGMGYLTCNSSHDMQVHIHHESFTFNLTHRHPKFIEYFLDPAARQYDDARLEAALRYHLDLFREETGIELTRWFFVHGHWALNGNDQDKCCITREIELLLKHGCRGDFTFPAGRGYTNPRLQVPYFVRPVDSHRGYDLPEAEPEYAYGNRAAAESKFFIWSSEVKHDSSSLDYYSAETRARLADPLSMAIDIVQKSVRVDGTLYFKTHAHSLYPAYYKDQDRPVFPHEYPAVRDLFGMILEAAAAADVEVEFLGASEVYDRFIGADRVPPESFRLTLDSQPVLLRGASAEPPPPPAPPQPPLEGSMASLVQRINRTLALRRGEEAATMAPPAAPSRPPEIPAADLTKVFRHVVGVRHNRTAQALNALLVPLAAAHIKKVGANEAGAYAKSHYLQRIRKGDLIGENEALVVDFLASLPGYAPVIEIGSGFGTLPMLAAAMGHEAIGVEVDARRFATGQLLAEAFAAEDPAAAERLQFVQGAFPQALAEHDLSNALAVVMDMLSHELLANLDSFVAGLARCAGAMIEITRFGERNMGADTQALLAQELQRRGLGPARELFARAGTRFLLFENRQTAA